MKKINFKYVNENLTTAYIFFFILVICVISSIIYNVNIFILIILCLMAGVYSFYTKKKFISKKNYIKENGKKATGHVVNYICTDGMIVSGAKDISDNDVILTSGSPRKIGNEINSLYHGYGASSYYKMFVEYNEPITNNIKTCLTPYIKHIPNEWDNMICDVYILGEETYVDNFRIEK